MGRGEGGQGVGGVRATGSSREVVSGIGASDCFPVKQSRANSLLEPSLLARRAMPP